jgi:molecular chaperone GrpE (heat shock protein)
MDWLHRTTSEKGVARMENESLSAHGGYSDIRAEGQRLFVTLTRANREAKDELRIARQSAERLALASVEALELVADTISGFHGALDANAQQALEGALAAASEKLRQADIEQDGVVGETIEPSKHRVVKSAAPTGRLPNRVTAIWRPGVRFKGQRIRQAEVAAEYVEGIDGTNRD